MKSLICALLLVALALGVEAHGRLRGVQKIHSASEIRQILSARTDKLKTQLQEYRQREKFGANLPNSIKFLANNYIKDYFTANITIGRPAKKFTVSVETGTSSLWVLSKDYPKLLKSQKGYNPGKSGKDTGSTFSATSGPYQVSGEVYKDTVSVDGDYDFDQNFAAITKIAPVDLFYPVDGALGFQWDPNHRHFGEDSAPIINFLEPCEKRWFTIWMAPHLPPSKGQAEALITFGSSANENCEKVSKFHPLTQSVGANQVLVFNVDAFLFGDYTRKSTTTASADSGFPIIQLPEVDYKAVLKITQPNYNEDLNLLTIPCANSKTLKDLVFTVGGKDYSVPATNYVVDLDLGGGNCVLAVGLNEDQTNYPTFAFGNPFIRSYCVTYNIDATSIAFSKIKAKKH